MSWTVYRVLGVGGETLYVGITENLELRTRQHLSRTTGINGATEVVGVEEHPTKAEAGNAERALIESERPRFNKMHNPDWHRRNRQNNNHWLHDEALGRAYAQALRRLRLAHPVEFDEYVEDALTDVGKFIASELAAYG